MVSKIKLTIGDKTYFPGDVIDKKISKTDEAFLKREGYVEEKPVAKKSASVNVDAKNAKQVV